MKEPYFTIFCGKLCRIGQDHAEPGEKQDHRSDRKLWKGYSRGWSWWGPSLTHSKPELMQMCNLKRVEITLLLLKCTDILQPVDKAVFRSVKNEFLRQIDNSARRCRSHKVTHANFVHMSFEAWRPSVTLQNILSSFHVTVLSFPFPFDVAMFVAHAPCDHIRHTAPLHALNPFPFLHQHNQWNTHCQHGRRTRLCHQRLARSAVVARSMTPCEQRTMCTPCA